MMLPIALYHHVKYQIFLINIFPRSYKKHKFLTPPACLEYYFLKIPAVFHFYFLDHNFKQNVIINEQSLRYLKMVGRTNQPTDRQGRLLWNPLGNQGSKMNSKCELSNILLLSLICRNKSIGEYITLRRAI